MKYSKTLLVCEECAKDEEQMDGVNFQMEWLTVSSDRKGFTDAEHFCSVDCLLKFYAKIHTDQGTSAR